LDIEKEGDLNADKLRQLFLDEAEYFKKHSELIKV
jgi:hypothetical protein